MTIICSFNGNEVTAGAKGLDLCIESPNSINAGSIHPFVQNEVKCVLSGIVSADSFSWNKREETKGGKKWRKLSESFLVISAGTRYCLS